MEFCKTADFGLYTIGCINAPDQVGFTPPSTTYDKMRQIQGFAQSLDLNIQSYVADPVFKASWNAWYENSWKPFFDKHAGPNATTGTKLFNTFYSDELAQQVESYRQQLNNFEADYKQQRNFQGQPVPELPGAGPSHVPPEQVRTFTSTVPWWAWALGGIALIGTGYLIAKKLQGRPKLFSRRDLDYNVVSNDVEKGDVPSLADYANVGKSRVLLL